MRQLKSLGTCSGQHGDRKVGDLPAHKQKQSSRQVISPVKVLDDDQQGISRRLARDDVKDGIENSKRLGTRVSINTCAFWSLPSQDFREDLGEVPIGFSYPPFERAWVFDHHASKNLNPWQGGGSAISFEAPANRDPNTLSNGAVNGLVCQACLPDSCLTDQHGKRPLAG
jgi:hypothetical protein